VTLAPGAPRTPAQPRLLFFVLAVVFLDAAGFGLVLPVLPKLVAALTGTKLSVAASYAGWIGFEYAVALFVCAPVLGALSDRFGRRPVLLLALTGLAANYGLMALAPTIVWLFVGRFLSGIGGATFSVASAFAADITPPDKRAQKFGLIGAAFGAGYVTGPVIGGLLGQHDLRLPFLAAAALALLNLVYGAFLVPETLTAENRSRLTWRQLDPLKALKGSWERPSLVPLLAVVFAYQLAMQTNPNIFPYYAMVKLGWTGRDIGISLAAVGIVLILVQGFLTKPMVRRLGAAGTVYVGLSFGAIGYVGFAFARTSWEIYAWLIVSALNFLTYPALQAIMSERVGADGQGKLQGSVASVAGLSAILVPPVMTGLFTHFSADGAAVWFPGAPFLAAALILLFGIGVFTATMAHKPQPAAPVVSPT
jgi:DHA1 family tetracycline resistance protein-like MFS transporter